MADFVKVNGKAQFQIRSKAIDIAHGRMHFWTIPEDMNPRKPDVILMPRNHYTAELYDFSGPFQNSVIVKSKSIPDIMLAAMVGKTGGEIIGHWSFEEGMPGFDAIIIWSDFKEESLLLTFDRPVHIDIIEIRKRIPAEFRQQYPDLIAWLYNEEAA
jgi:hypothetical protein